MAEDSAIVELIRRVESDLRSQIADVAIRVTEMEYGATIEGLRGQIVAIEERLASMVSQAETAAAAAIDAASDAEAAAESAEAAADDAEDSADDADDSDGGSDDDDDESGSTDEPELLPPETDDKTPDRRPWYNRPVFGG